jgi:hypothetical protein
MSTLIWDDKNILQHVWSYKPHVFDSIYPFGASWATYPILTRVKHLTRSGMCHSFFRGLSFSLMGYIAPSICVTESGIPDSELDQKIMKYDEM